MFKLNHSVAVLDCLLKKHLSNVHEIYLFLDGRPWLEKNESNLQENHCVYSSLNLLFFSEHNWIKGREAAYLHIIGGISSSKCQ